MRHHQRVIQPGLVAGVAQLVGVALGVAEFDRVERHLGQLDAGKGAVVEGPAQPVSGLAAHVMAAMAAHQQVLRQFGMEDHLLAGRALHPQIVRHLAPAQQGADLGADIFGQPVHAALLEKYRFKSRRGLRPRPTGASGPRPRFLK